MAKDNPHQAADLGLVLLHAPAAGDYDRAGCSPPSPAQLHHPDPHSKAQVVAIPKQMPTVRRAKLADHAATAP